MANMIPISTVIIGSGGASSIDFNNIPQNYTDLKLVWSGRLSDPSTATYCKFKLNGSTSNFSAIRLYGSGSASGTGSLPQWSGTAVGANLSTSLFSNVELYFANYTSSNNKPYSLDTVTENNATEAYAEFGAGIWSNTSPITSISIYGNNGNFTQYSSATLYGIRNY